MTQLLAIDIGGGTQDILLLDTRSAIENCIKMVLPSPTTLVARRIQKATVHKKPLLFTGVNMGGGPSTSALKKHLKAGLQAFSTPEAATTFNDDLQEVASWGVTLVSEDEAQNIKKADHIETRDLDLNKLSKVLKTAGVQFKLDGMAVAVQDHGAAPPGMSDRLFRFQHLRRSVEAHNSLFTFAYLAQEVPPHLTRMMAVVKSLPPDIPLLLLDTGPAAALGALEDSAVREQPRTIVVNVGNFHTLAFHLRQDNIMGLFEHHTGDLNTEQLDNFITKLCQGRLSNEEIFSDGGHGCLILTHEANLPFITVTGPNRRLMRGSSLRPHFAVPHGDMMLSCCFGLVSALAYKLPEWREEIEGVLGV
jgi:uncharacterized protein (DUF1786 family)